jgi:hypothetical protein
MTLNNLRSKPQTSQGVGSGTAKIGEKHRPQQPTGDGKLPNHAISGGYLLQKSIAVGELEIELLYCII